MAVWVSRYSNKELQSGKYYPVGISVGAPRFRLGYVLRDKCYSLAPRRDMLKMGIEEYKTAYFKKLEDIGTNKIIKLIDDFKKAAEEEGKDLVFLCFEDIRIPGEWCHRTLFAEWWAEKTGELIEELSDPSEPKIKKTKKEEPVIIAEKGKSYQQMNLFSMAGI